VGSDSEVDEPKLKKTALEDLFGSDVLMTGVSESTTQSLTSQIDYEIARYRKDIPIPLKNSATNSVSFAGQTVPVLSHHPWDFSSNQEGFLNSRLYSHSTED